MRALSDVTKLRAWMARLGRGSGATDMTERSPIDRDLPGAELVEQGLQDLAAGFRSIPALLVAVGSPRLRSLGLPLPPESVLPHEPELLLYRLIGESGEPDAHSRYNALIRRLVSFERALEHRQSRRARQDGKGS